jgi:transposase
MYEVDLYGRVRLAVLGQGLSQRESARRFGIDRGTVRKMLGHSVAKILGDGTRKRSTLFGALQSHYVFKDRCGCPGKGNDKGKVEAMVGYARRTFMVPDPRAPTAM